MSLLFAAEVVLVFALALLVVSTAFRYHDDREVSDDQRR